MTVGSRIRGGGSHSAYVRSPAGQQPVDEWRIYRWWGNLPPESGWWRRFLAWLLGGWQQLIYLGQTGRNPLVRALEHALEKTWAADALCLEIDPRVWRSEAEVLAYEAAAIRRERPVWNIAHNGNNPGAVRLRRHLPRHVVARRLRALSLLFGWFVVAAAVSWAAGQAMPPRNALIAGSLTATVVLIKAGRRRRH